MAITTLQGMKAGMLPPQFFSKVGAAGGNGLIRSLWMKGGTQGTAVQDTTTAGGVARSSSSALVPGQIPFNNPLAGNNSYLARMGAIGAMPGPILLVDRLWECGANSGGVALDPTLTSSQTINSVTWPARDSAGSTNGADVLIALEVWTTMGAGTPTLTLGYTNSAGVGSLTSTNVFSTAAAAVNTSLHFFGLNNGDLGVQSVQSLTLSATWTSGGFSLVALRVLAILDQNGAESADAGAMRLCAPRMFNGSVPFICVNANNGAQTPFGSIQFAQG